MIIFGTRTGKLKSPQTTAYDCSYCNTEKSVWYYFFQKYIHIFWIPVIPIGKTGSSVCSHCKQVLSANEMQENQKQEFLNTKKELKTPFGYKIVLILVACLFALPFLIGFFSQMFGKAS
jgi:uncharacterized Zn-finger protein